MMDAAFDHEASQPSVARILLQHISTDERPKLLRDLIRSLRADDQAGLDFIASLVLQQSDSFVTQELISFLDKAIRSGRIQCAVSVSLRHSQLGLALLRNATECSIEAKFSGNGCPYDDLVNYLRFIKSTVSHLALENTHIKLFHVCLELLQAANQEICVAARNVVFEMLSMQRSESIGTIILPHQVEIWTCIQTLINLKTKFHILNGYSLWLRWILSAGQHVDGDLITHEYWQAILHGLRHGDTEVRKICLHVLKSTVATDAAAVPKELHQLYDRYCTIFETIVLGRYINQIQECEKDLKVLATDTQLQPQWLYVLLSSALDSRMQESNRKFIGNWVMRSQLRPDAELVSFLRDDFLPWAIQGQLFVSSLRRQNGILRCSHGDRLARFIRDALQNSSKPGQIADAIAAMMEQKRKSIFPYATVYLLEGSGDSLSSDQIQSVTEPYRLPEVARDFVNLKISKSDDDFCDCREQPSRRETVEKDVIERCRDFTGDIQLLQDIWSKVEWLEYSKKAVMLLPAVLLHPAVVEQAVGDPVAASDLADKLHALLEVAGTKTFLFPPLILAMRTTALTMPNAIGPLRMVDILVHIAERPPEPTIDLLLEEAISHLTPFTYEHYFGERTSYGFAAYLDLVGRLNTRPNLVQSLLSRVLEPWRTQKQPIPTVSPWKKTLQLQVLLLCFEQYVPESSGHIYAHLDDLFHILAIEPLPRYRYLLEWIIVRMFITHDLRHDLLRRIGTKDHHSNPKYLASLMKIGTILACHKDSREDFALQLATSFIPLAASSKVVIRHEAQWQVPVLMDHVRTKKWTSITRNAAFNALDEYIRSLERFHDPPTERQIGRLDPEIDHTISNLVEGRWYDLDQTEAPLTSHDEFVNLYEEQSPSNAPVSCMHLGDRVDKPKVNAEQEVTTDSKAKVGPKTAEDVAALQTKGTAYLARTLSDLGDQHIRPENLIIVGSLVDNPYNLGGLSRVSEIFGASALCLQNQNVLSNKDFTSVSVSSHLHFPIVQLSASGIPAFLAERKAQGFTVVGIEQTDRSVQLGSKEATLPEKVVLVVGSEKEGIPAVVLTECDILVEIPQQGVTRSLNVQTAVSIVLYEHARQHRKASQTSP